MPPKENDRLTKEQTAFVRRWIAAGAPWPDEKAQARIRKREWSVLENEDGVIIPTSGGLADEWTYRRYKPEDIWAFKPVTKPEIPIVVGPSLRDGPSNPEADSAAERAGLQSDRCVHRSEASCHGVGTGQRRRRLPDVDPTRHLRPDRFAANSVRRSLSVPSRRGRQDPQTSVGHDLITRLLAEQPALRRTLGAALAGCRALCRYSRFLERLRTVQCVALPRLCGSIFQPRQAVQRVYRGTDRWR